MATHSLLVKPMGKPAVILARIRLLYSWKSSGISSGSRSWVMIFRAEAMNLEDLACSSRKGFTQTTFSSGYQITSGSRDLSKLGISARGKPVSNAMVLGVIV